MIELFMSLGFFTNPLNIGLIIYSLTVFILLFLVFRRAREYYKLSNHKGILFFGLGFLMMGIGNICYLPIKYPPFSSPGLLYLNDFARVFFYFCFNLSSFFVVFSQFQNKIKYNLREAISILVLLSFLVSVVDTYVVTGFLIFFPLNIAMFVLLAVRTFLRYSSESISKSKKLKFMFFMVMFLTLVTWSMNYVVKYLFSNSAIFMVLLVLFSLMTHSLLLYIVRTSVGGRS